MAPGGKVCTAQPAASAFTWAVRRAPALALQRQQQLEQQAMAMLPLLALPPRPALRLMRQVAACCRAPSAACRHRLAWAVEVQQQQQL